SEALGQMCYLVPSASGIFGADSPNFNFSNAGIGGYAATNGTCYGVDDKSTKIVYFSPNFAGFSFAASFTPDNTEDSRNTDVNGGGAATRFNNNTGENSENLSVAANFSHDFNGVNLVVGGGGTWSFDREVQGFTILAGTPPVPTFVPNNVDERREYNAYAQVGFSGFTIGGAYSLRQNTDVGGADQQVFGFGGTYNFDAWTVGLGYTHATYEHGVTKTFGSVFPDTIAHSNIYSLTASYALGPGIQIDGVAEYYDYQGDEGPVQNDFSGFALGLGTLISF
ncbi:MAG: porin, partial [Vicinamibacterales bacterium]